MLSPKEFALQLPQEAGVYRFYDDEDNLLYVGKAKFLKNRVSNYFANLAQHSNKTKQLVSQIHRIEFTIVPNEYDALLLENSLIKTNQPKYNILLKDDKSYPYICITDEPFPRLLVTRQPETLKGTFFGPFAQQKSMQILLDFIHELYALRSCAYNLSKANVEAKKYKVCLDFHIGKCLGGCEGKQSEEDYQENINQIIYLLKGNTNEVKKSLKQKMLQASENWLFEEAQSYKDKLDKLDFYQSKSLIVNPNMGEVDVVALLSDEENAYLHYFRIQEGTITHTQNHHIKKKLEETDEEIITSLAFYFRTQYQSQAQEIITNIPLDIEINHITNTVPKIGDKKKLLDIALKNVFRLKQDIRTKSQETAQKNQEPTQAVQELQKVLQMPTPPLHIECFDNSNIQGTNPVASMVCFKDGKPSKSNYRHFHIKTVVGANDFASMYEIVTRRYTRLINEDKPFPDLVVIDGGKGQLSSACDALKALGIYGKFYIVGIAKRLEEIYFPEDNIPLHINKKSLALKLIQKIRDEAHRFAITFHRDTRSKNVLKDDLLEIEGFGTKTVDTLRKTFKTLKKMNTADKSQLIELIGEAKTEILLKYLAEASQPPKGE